MNDPYFVAFCQSFENIVENSNYLCCLKLSLVLEVGHQIAARHILQHKYEIIFLLIELFKAIHVL